MMSSTEFLYVEDEHATGFLKQYEGARYAFAALLPNEDISIDDYIASLDGRRLAYMLANANNAIVEAKMPKFKTEYDIEMSLILKTMGLDNVFAGEYTNFGEMAEMHDGTPLAIGNVLHKTYIEVIESGTRAAAVTVASMAPGAAPGEIKSVTLDRPFVYAIVDTETGLPIFIGALRDIADQ
jgi:serpin B